MQSFSANALSDTYLFGYPLQTYVNYDRLYSRSNDANTGDNHVSHATGNRILDPQTGSSGFGYWRINGSSMAQGEKATRLPLWVSVEGEKGRIGELDTQPTKLVRRSLGDIPKNDFELPKKLWRVRGSP